MSSRFRFCRALAQLQGQQAQGWPEVAMLSSVTMSKQTDVLHYSHMSMIAYADSLPLLFRWDGCQDVKRQGRGAEKGGTDSVTNKWAEVYAERPAPSGLHRQARGRNRRARRHQCARSRLLPPL
jgi:hypothetical protein